MRRSRYAVVRWTLPMQAALLLFPSFLSAQEEPRADGPSIGAFRESYEYRPEWPWGGTAPEAAPRDGPSASRQPPEIGFRHNLSHPDHLDRQGLALIGMGVIDSVHQVGATLEPGGEIEHALTWTVVGFLDWIALSMAHEYGHMSSHTKFGCIHHRVGSREEPPSAWKRATVENVFAAFTTREDAFISISSSDMDRIGQALAGRPQDYYRYRASVEAGGLNQDQVMLSQYADRLLGRRFNPDDAVPYVVSALSTLTYPPSGNNDMSDYADSLAFRGIGTDETRIRAISLARFLSGSAWAAVCGFAESVRGSAVGPVGPICIARIGDGEILWPEVECFLSEFGPTIQVGVPVTGDTWSLRPTYQQVIANGVSMGEAGVRLEKEIHPRLSVQALAVVNSEAGGWFEAGLLIRPFSCLSLMAGYAYGRGYSLHRDVYGATADYLEANESSIRLGVSTQFSF